MIFSYKELKRLANLDKSIKLEDVNQAINSLGFEVEENIPFGNVAGVMFGKVLTLTKNPNADTLTVVELEFTDKGRTIQTNATNLQVGDVVVAFVPGSSKDGVEFGSKELQGIMSEGMLTSIGEFGVDKDLVRDTHEGIMTYNYITDLSIDPIEELGLRDILIDVDILSNRPDAQSYLVMAKELAAYFRTTPLKLETNKASLDSNIKTKESKLGSLAMLEAKVDFTIKPNEQILLAKSGIKSINDIVDLTNLTLIMTGQPTHAYDKTKVGTEFSIDLASKEVETLGSNKVNLEKNLVILADGEVASVAGVIGLESNKVTADTNEVIFELGLFDSKLIRESMKAIKLSPKAAVQSSKNIGVGSVELAIEYLSSKLNNFSEAVGVKAQPKREIDFSLNSTSLLAGFDITKHEKFDDVSKALASLGFIFNKDTVEIPSYRYDIDSSQDINEELFRFFGYNTFEPVAPKFNAPEVHIVTDHKETIAARGYNEVSTYTLISEEKNVINPFEFEEVIKLETFVSKEREVIRSSQAVSVLEIIEYNNKRGMHNVSIFSEGMISNGIFTHTLASTTKTFEEMKADVVNIMNENITFERTDNKELHPGVSAIIKLDGKQVGWIGKVNPLHTTTEAFIAELILDEAKHISKVEEYSNEPLKKRDITFELKEREELSSHIDSLNAESIEIIDIFEKDGIKKVTVRLTVTDDQIKELG